MRMKTIKALRAAACWTQQILEVRVPWRSVYGLRTR